MLALHDRATRFCDGLPRREFLRVGGLGTLGLALPELIQSRTMAAPFTQAVGERSTFGRAKHCILLYLWGGPPHQDTFDMKPEAPVEVRGEFLPIPTNVPGIFISDHLPLIARHADKFTIVRTVSHKDGDHIAVVHDMMTGNRYQRINPIVTARRSDAPNYGAVLARLKPRNNGLPEYVQLPCLLQSNSGKICPGQNGGYLGKAYDPFLVKAISNYEPLHDPTYASFSPRAITLRDGLTEHRLRSRRSLLAALEQRFRSAELNRELDGFDSNFQQAFAMVSSPAARRAFDISAEDRATRERYGMDPFGQSVLMSRRLVEAGMPLVTVYWRNGRRRTDIGWDNHINNFVNLKHWQLPPTDMAFSTLLDELSERGMLDETLVVLMGEFGRTPAIDANGGRQHWPYCYSVVMAGGGIRGGEVFGASDAKAAYPVNSPVSPMDLGATIYHLLGIDGDIVLHDFEDRPRPVCRGTPIAGLIGA